MWYEYKWMMISLAKLNIPSAETLMRWIISWIAVATHMVFGPFALVGPDAFKFFVIFQRGFEKAIFTNEVCVCRIMHCHVPTMWQDAEMDPAVTYNLPCVLLKWSKWNKNVNFDYRAVQMLWQIVERQFWQSLSGMCDIVNCMSHSFRTTETIE